MSVWERPEELQGRSDVDKMVQGPPETPGIYQLVVKLSLVAILLHRFLFLVICHLLWMFADTGSYTEVFVFELNVFSSKYL